MEGLVCDACGGGLLLEEEARYILRIEGFAAYDPLEVTRADLDRDLEAETRTLIESLSELDAKTAEDQIHKSFRFDLCCGCWQRYIRDPLRGLRGLDSTADSAAEGPTQEGPTQDGECQNEKSQGD